MYIGLILAVLRQYFRQFLELFADACHPAARQFGCIARLSQFVNLIRASLQNDKGLPGQSVDFNFLGFNVFCRFGSGSALCGYTV